jgi:hypothetical protein
MTLLCHCAGAYCSRIFVLIRLKGFNIVLIKFFTPSAMMKNYIKL